MTRATCWYPGGIHVEGDSPCNPSAEQSTCCGPSDICLSNNLCFVVNLNALHRGSCTDETWGSAACATNICGTIHGWADVKECPDNAANFYCGLDASACNNSATSFPLQRGFFADYRNVSTITVSPSTAATVTVSLTVTASRTAVASNVDPATLATSSPVCPSSSIPLIAVGAGVGVPLGLGLVCALACLLWMRKRRGGPEHARPRYSGRTPAFQTVQSPKEMYANHARELGHGEPHEMLAR